MSYEMHATTITRLPGSVHWVFLGLWVFLGISFLENVKCMGHVTCKKTVLAEKELDLIIWFEKTTDLTDKNVTAIFPLDRVLL